MKKGKWKSRKGAAFLALALTLVLGLGLSCTGLLNTQAAGPVETERECRLVIDTAELFKNNIENDYGGDILEGHDITLQDVLEGVKLTVNLYKVADISAGAKYTAVAPFDGKNVLLEEGGKTFADAVSTVNSETKAEEWEKMALATAGAVKTDTKKADSETTSGKVDQIMFGTLSGEEVEDGLEPGMYLVMVEDVVTPYYTYRFTPYLVSLPNNNYAPEAVPPVSDEWVYDVEMGLKPERESRPGSLLIKKDVKEMSLLPGNEKAMFVFRLDVDPLDSTLPNYTDYTAITFEGAEQKEVTVSDLPAGSTVTVTEVYSGGGYEQESVAPDPAVIIIKADGTEGAPVTVTFTNVPDDTTTGGYGVINNIAPDSKGGWKWNQKTESGSPAGEVKE